MREKCTCDETLVGGVRIEPPQWHNCEYISRVNGYVGASALHADSITTRDAEEGKAWMREFSKQMNFHRLRVIAAMETRDETETKPESNIV